MHSAIVHANNHFRLYGLQRVNLTSSLAQHFKVVAVAVKGSRLLLISKSSPIQEATLS